jgi:hypothetical protein
MITNGILPQTTGAVSFKRMLDSAGPMRVYDQGNGVATVEGVSDETHGDETCSDG